ncbi:MAG: NRDE family protein [Gammaproteobacteria bacterium]|nr:NRDE family protein [Gammaproteobacteria bacterium]
MCLIAFAWQMSGRPLLLLGNRDEFHPRPTRPACFWNEEGQPDLLAGKDLEAGGTWLGVTRSGRFAALTNIRSPQARPGPLSRGKLVLDYLTGRMSPQAYMQGLSDSLGEYAGFNLLAGSMQELWFLNSDEGQARALEPGVYGLSNASLNSPWPKLQALCKGLEGELERDSDSDTLLELLKDSREYPDEELPDSGVGLDWERRLSATFILGEDYGTRACSLLAMDADGSITFVEQSFGPDGQELGESGWIL